MCLLSNLIDINASKGTLRDFKLCLFNAAKLLFAIKVPHVHQFTVSKFIFQWLGVLKNFIEHFLHIKYRILYCTVACMGLHPLPPGEHTNLTSPLLAILAALLCASFSSRWICLSTTSFCMISLAASKLAIWPLLCPSLLTFCICRSILYRSFPNCSNSHLIWAFDTWLAPPSAIEKM